MTVTLWGAGGGSSISPAGGGTQTGGAGACLTGTLLVTPGETLTIIVGQAGCNHTVSSGTRYGGGGAPGGGPDRGYSSSGGGRSAIRRSTTDVVTVGAGGGGRQGTPGGAGGITTGGAGTNNATGGTQSAGGGGNNQGSLYTGANGAQDNSAGGGAGYYGGGAGGQDQNGAGGSSLYSNLLSYTGYTSATGVAPNNTSPLYVTGVGNGGTYAGGGTGGPGLVVLSVSNLAAPPLQVTIAPPSFSPTSIPGCSLWLDGADSSSSSMTLSGSTITNWKDKSGNGVTFTVGGTPTLSNAAYNSLSSVYFNGSANFYNTTFSLNLVNHSFFIVTYQPTGGNVGVLVFHITGTGTDDVYSPNALQFASPEFGVQGSYGAQPYSNLTYGIYGDVATPTNNSLILYKNGTSVITKTGLTTASSTGIAVGSRVYSGGYTYFMTGYVSEVIVYNTALTDIQRKSIEGYLGWKWGIQANLPVGHPYLTYSPKSGVGAGTSPLQITLGSSSIRALGGVTTIYNSYKIHTFATAGTATFTVTPPNALTVKVLVVGGGGGGGATTNLYGGGGGAGGLVYSRTMSLTPGTYQVVVGAGGPAGTIGGDSTFNGLVAYGGGYGGASTTAGGNGGCGGGGGGVLSSVGGTGSQGFAGSQGNSQNVGGGGGGGMGAGGATGRPLAGAGTNGFRGGDGAQVQITGTPTYYAGGGGGGGGNGVSGGAVGGEGGGGTGGGTTTATAGTAGLGGGGGAGAAGGSGTVIMAYLLPGQIATVTTPTVAAGLIFWMDGADPAGTGVLPANGASITTWVDKSGNGKNATASAAATYSLSTKSLVFTGAQYYTTPFTTVPTTISVFLVINIGGGGYMDMMAGVLQVISNGYNQLVTIPGGSHVLNGATMASGTTLLYNFTFDSSASAAIYYNGALTGTRNGSTSYTGNGSIVIGSSDGVHETYTGTISEILIYNSVLSTTNRQKIEGYLAWKWGFASNLSASNPYKYDLPM